MRNNPGENSSGSSQAELTVTIDCQDRREVRALSLGGGYRRGRSNIHLKHGFTHAVMLAVPAAAGRESILSRRKEGRCHGQAHRNRQ